MSLNACVSPSISASVRDSMMNFRSRKAALGSWSVTGAPRLSLLAGIAAKENARFRDIFVLAMFCTSQNKKDSFALLVRTSGKVDPHATLPTNLGQAVAEVRR